MRGALLALALLGLLLSGCVSDEPSTPASDPADAPDEASFAADAPDEGNATSEPAANQTTAAPAAANETAPAGNATGNATGNVTGNATPAAPFAVHLSFAAGSPAQGCVLIVFTFGPLDGVAYATADLPAETGGRAFTATFSSTLPASGFAIGFAAGSSVSTDATGAGPTLEGTVPDGSESVVAAACGGGMVEVDFTVA